jgi:ABC-type multidrug transport system fused ATPase/permease subunit
MEDTTMVLDPLIEQAQEYGKTSIELYKLKAVERSSALASTFLSRYIAFFALSLFILMISVGFAFWLGDLLGMIWLGFLSVGTFYGFVAAILYFVFYSPIKRCINNVIISEILN